MTATKTLQTLAREFDQYRESIGMSPNTRKGDRANLGLFLKWLRVKHGIRTPDRIHQDHLEDYQKHLATCVTNRGMGLRPTSINGRVSAVRVFLEYLARHGHVAAGLVEGIRYVKEPSLLPTSVLQHKEVKHIFRRLDISTPIGYRNRTALEILYSAGLRRGEILGLDVQDVDVANSLLKVTGKGDKERMVPIGKTALRFLQTYLKAVRPAWRGSTECDALFLSVRGKRLAPGSFRAVVAKCCGQASVRVTPHTFRRSCTTELIRGNANLYHVKDLLGHESLATLKPYTKLTIFDLKKTHARCHPRERD